MSDRDVHVSQAQTITRIEDIGDMRGQAFTVHKRAIDGVQIHNIDKSAMTDEDRMTSGNTQILRAMLKQINVRLITAAAIRAA